MAIDTPARLAIIGAGPIGLEAALYARFLGYNVVIFERGEVAANVRPGADEFLEAPFHANSTPLGIAAIEAQDDSYVPPSANELLTGQQWLDRYLLPLSQTDLLSDHLRLHTIVVAVGSENTEDGDPMLTVSSRDIAGQERSETFDGILECTGADSTQTWQPSEDTAQYYHLVGEKHPAATTPFRLTDAYNQIRHAFTIIGEREALDLYASAHRLLR